MIALTLVLSGCGGGGGGGGGGGASSVGLSATAETVAGLSNDRIEVTFGADVAMADAETLANYQLESPVGQAIDLTGARVVYTPADRTAVLTLAGNSPAQNLQTGAAFQLSATAIRALGGGTVSAAVAGVVAGDDTAPQLELARVDLSRDGTGRVVTVRFDEAVDPTAAGTPATWQVSGVTVQTATVTFDAMAVRLGLSGPAIAGATTVSIASLKDAAGNALAPVSGRVIDGADRTPPALVDLTATATAGSDDVVTVRYDEAVNAADAIDRAAFQLESPTGQSVDLTGAGLSYDSGARRTTLSLPSGTLSAGATVTLTVTGVRDDFGNAMASLSLTGTVASGGPDSTPPRPVDLAATTRAGIANDSLVVTLSEAVDAGDAGTLANYRLESPPGVAVELAGSNPTYDAARRTVTFALTRDLRTGDVATLFVENVADLAGNRAPAGTSIASAVAGDARPPEVDEAIQDLGLDPSGRTVRVRFDESVSRATAETTSSWRLGSGAAPVSAVRTAADEVELVFPDLVTPGSDALEISGVEDTAGNSLAPTAVPLVSTDTTAPQTTALAAMAVENAGGDSLALTFSERVRAGDATDLSHYSLEAPVGTPRALAGSATLDGAGRQLTIALSGVELPFGASARLTVSGVRDLGGNAVAAGTMVTATVSGDGAGPALAGATATALSGAANDTLTVRFAEDVELASATDVSHYELEQPTGTLRDLSTATVSYDAATRTATLSLGGAAPVNLQTRAPDSFTLRAVGVRDLAGNADVAALSGVVGGDRQAPSILQAVQRDPTTVDVVFDEVLDGATVDAGDIQASGGQTTTGATLRPGGTTIRATFDAPVAPASTTLAVSAVRDLAGNPLAAVSGVPVTGDTTPPTLSSASVETLSGLTNDRAAVTFSEDVDAAGASDLMNFTLESPSGSPISLTGATATYDPATRTTRLELAADLRTGAGFTIRVSNVEDSAGNAIAGGASVSGTVTGDSVAPALVASSPTAGAMGVATTIQPSLTFSEAVDPASASAAISLVTAGGGSVPAAVTLDSTGTVATLTPASSLSGDTAYEVTVSAGLIDPAGNAAAPVTLGFRTAPAVLTVTALQPSMGDPAGGETVELTGQAFRLGMAVRFGAVNATAVQVLSPTRLTCVVPPAAAPSSSGPTAVSVTALRRDGQSATLTGGWTYSSDSVSPEVTAANPVLGAGNVVRNHRILLRFSEPIDPATVVHTGGGSDSLIVFQETGSRINPNRTRLTGTIAFSADGRGVTFLPPSTFDNRSRVRLALTSAVEDRAGNSLVTGSVSDPLSLSVLLPGTQVFETSFRVGNRDDLDRPSVFAFSPASGATNVSTGRVIQVTFSEAIDPTTVTSSSLAVLAGSQPIGGRVQVSSDGLVASFSPHRALAGQTSYTVSLTTAVADAAGNALTGTLASTFMTADTGIRVTAVTPPDGAVGVPPNQRAVTVSFDQELDPATITASSFIVRPAGGASLAGARSVAADRRSATFTASADLAAATRHRVELSTAIRGALGNALTAPFAGEFTTAGSGDTTPPTVLSISPTDGASGVSLGVTVVATLSEPLDPSSVNSTTATIRPGSPPSGGAVAANVSLTGTNDDGIRIDPSANLAAATTYTVTLSTGIRDLAGNPLAASFTSTFTTEVVITDATAPTVDALTLNAIPPDFNGTDSGEGTLLVPPSGFTIHIAYSDVGGSGIDVSSLSVVSDQPLGGGAATGGVDAGQNFAARFTATSSGATLRVPSSLAFPTAAQLLRVTIRDGAGNLSAERSFDFLVEPFTAQSQPFENEKTWFFDFSADRERNGDVANGVPDFQEDLLLYGLRSGSPVAVNNTSLDSNQVVQNLIEERSLEIMRGFYGYSGTRNSVKGAINLRFVRTNPGGTFSRMVVGGGDGSSGTLGRAFLVLNNSGEVDNNLSGTTLLGIFTLNCFNNFSGQSSFSSVFNPLIATPVGADSNDPTILDPGFDRMAAGNTSAQNQRYDVVFDGIETLARVIGNIGAHEAGHSVGLVADDALPNGLLGGSLGNSTSAHVREGAGANLMDASVSFNETQNLGASFTDLNRAYLEETAIRKP